MKSRTTRITIVFVVLFFPGINLGDGPSDLDLDAEHDMNRASVSNNHAIPGSPSTTARLLVDRSHHNNFNVSGLTDHLTANGWIVGELATGPVTKEALHDWDIFLVPARTLGGLSNFTEGEVDAVETFLENGGGLWAFHEYSKDPTGINSLTSRFGVSFFDDTVSDPTDNHGPGYEVIALIRKISQHSITDGVDSFFYRAGCCLDVQSPALVVAKGDEDASSLNCASSPPVLAVTSDIGRAVFCGDITPLHPDYFPERLSGSELQLLINTAIWLATASVPVEDQSWSKLKCLYR